MRYLGLDLGTKTLGVAISDETKTIATPLKTIQFNENAYDDALEQLKESVLEFQIQKIVLGFPKNMNNTIGPRAMQTLEFEKKLEQIFNLEVVLQDERLSTVLATSYLLEADVSRKKRKKVIDKMAASVILQTYLDKERGKLNE